MELQRKGGTMQTECNVCGVIGRYATCPGCAQRLIRYYAWRRSLARQRSER